MRGTAALVLAGALTTTMAAAEERRELGAHEHGHSTLTIAVEGTRVAMELTAPFAFFERFPGAEEVAVTLLTERGQTSYEVTRAAPRLVLGRLM
jgi:hypothetical protein